MRTTTKPPKGGKGGNNKTFGRLNYYNLAVQLRMRHRIFTRPFIVDLLSEGKPMINTVLLMELALEVLHETCMRKLFLLAIQKERYIRN